MKNKTGAIIIEGHVQGLSNTRSLGEKGIPVIVIDSGNCVARFSKYCSKYFRCPEYNSEEFITFVIDICKKENLYGWILIPSNDHAVKNISQNKNKLLSYYKIVTDDYKIISKIYNKKELLNIAERIHIPIPKTYYPSNLNLESFNIKYPVIVKGIEGLSFYKALGKKALFCKNRKQLDETLKQVNEKVNLEKIFIQEVIEKKANSYVCSFTSFSIKGEIKTFWIGEKVREHPPNFGTATFARSITINETFKYSKELLKELEYTGVSEIEFIMDSKESRYKLIEMNARTWLWVSLAKACGVDYALFIYNFVNKIDTDFPEVYNSKLNWINLWTDGLSSLVSIIKGKYSFKEYKKSFTSKNIKAVFSTDDWLPFIMLSIILPYLFIKRT